jgi:hypothetical protein
MVAKRYSKCSRSSSVTKTIEASGALKAVAKPAAAPAAISARLGVGLG